MDMKQDSPIWFWDDERAIGNSLIVTLRYGWSFDPSESEHVRGFDTVAEARHATARKRLHQCACEECTVKNYQPVAKG
jgi:hypothetical protein